MPRSLTAVDVIAGHPLSVPVEEAGSRSRGKRRLRELSPF